MSHKAGWAFGLGLERLAMVLFSIPDIRLFWSPDPRFLSQFAEGQISSFQPYSKYPPCYRDMSFWIPEVSPLSLSTEGPGGWHENDYCEIVRDVAGDLIETVEKVTSPSGISCGSSPQIDEFTHPKTKRNSKTFRLNYRSMDRSLSNEEVNVLQDQVQRRIVQEMGIEMR
jgi:phenylalanyl-tRNA synthetase alpha chain